MRSSVDRYSQEPIEQVVVDLRAMVEQKGEISWFMFSHVLRLSVSFFFFFLILAAPTGIPISTTVVFTNSGHVPYSLNLNLSLDTSSLYC